jgi:S1-C subfamily serine protease
MILTIRHLSGSLAGKSQRVALKDGQVLRLGRAADSDILFSESMDDTVSGVHAELSFDGQRLFIEDKRSANGTFVNGAPCPAFQKVAVPDGSRIRLAAEGPEMQVVVEAGKGIASPGATSVDGATLPPPKESVGKVTLLREIDRARQEERDLVTSQLAGSQRSSNSRLLGGLAAVLLVAAVGIGGYAWWNARQTAARAAADAAVRLQELAKVTNAWAEVEQKVSPAVVHIRCSYRIRAPNGRELTFSPITGSGVQIRPGLILTARHVAEPWRFFFRGRRADGDVAPGDVEKWNWDDLEEKHRFRAEYDWLEVQFPGQRPLKATLVSGTGERPEDLALLQVQPTIAPVVGIGRSNDDVKVTDEIAIIGYPGDLGQYEIAVSNSTGVGDPVAQVTEVVPTFIKGTVAQPLTGTGASSHLLFFDASIEPGNSGGPVVNRQGELVGIVSMQFNRPGEPVNLFGFNVPTWKPMNAGSVAVSPDDIQSFLRKHGIV